MLELTIHATSSLLLLLGLLFNGLCLVHESQRAVVVDPLLGVVGLASRRVDLNLLLHNTNVKYIT